MEYDVELNLQIWKQLKPHLIGGDVDEAAVDFVATLVEHGISVEDLASYALDSELKEALRDYTDDDIIHDDEEYDDDYPMFDD